MNKGGEEMPTVRPIEDLQQPNEIFEMCHEKKEPIVLTTKGYGDLVVMSIKTYAQLLEGNQIDAILSVSDKSYKDDIKRLNAKACLSSLRRKTF